MKGSHIYLMENGRFIERDHEPPEWLVRYSCLAEMHSHLIHQRTGGQIDDSPFRRALMLIADDLTAQEHRAGFRVVARDAP